MKISNTPLPCYFRKHVPLEWSHKLCLTISKNTCVSTVASRSHTCKGEEGYSETVGGFIIITILRQHLVEVHVFSTFLSMLLCIAIKRTLPCCKMHLQIPKFHLWNVEFSNLTMQRKIFFVLTYVLIIKWPFIITLSWLL